MAETVETRHNRHVIEYTSDRYLYELVGQFTITVEKLAAKWYATLRRSDAPADVAGIELDQDDIRRLRHELDVIERLITRL